MSHPVKRVSENPLSHALRVLGMTRADFGAKYSIGKSYLLRMSQGRTSSMSEFVQRALLEEADIRGLEVFIDLDTSWDRWIHQHRAAQSLPAPDPDTSLSPFERMVKAVGGTTRMAAILAVPDVLVTRYLRGTTTSMPGPIREALEEMRYPHRVALERGMDQWIAISQQ